MNLRIMSAFDFACIAHEGQKRGDGTTPYITHPLAVGLILSEYGYDEDTIIAGILHDVIEDTDFSFDDIKERFGDNVADMVLAVTEDNTLPRDQIFISYLLSVKNSKKEIKAVCAADMLHNRLSLIQELKKGNTKIWDALHSNKERYLRLSYERLDAVKESISEKFVNEIENSLREIEAIG